MEYSLPTNKCPNDAMPQVYKGNFRVLKGGGAWGGYIWDLKIGGHKPNYLDVIWNTPFEEENIGHSDKY